jgi:DNA-binding CsgD family transcriptional regulator
MSTARTASEPYRSQASTLVNVGSTRTGKPTNDATSPGSGIVVARPGGLKPDAPDVLHFAAAARALAPGASGSVEVARSGEGFRHRVRRLVSHADEVLSMVPTARLTEDAKQTIGAIDLAALEGGARVRTLYREAIVSDAPSMRFVHDAAAAGEEARFLEDVPTWLTIIGREVVVVPRDPGCPDLGALFIHGGGHVGTALWLFTNAWQAASPMEQTCDRIALSVWEQRVLFHLARGIKDECGARRLGISPRTYRRHVTTLCAQLGASSRFEAGVRAAKAGLI